MNDKYIVKFEAGLMEQVVKLQNEEVKGIADVEKFIDDDFMKVITEGFNNLHSAIQNAKKKNRP